MPRKLFCEISPLAYRISTIKCRTVRGIKREIIRDSNARVMDDTSQLIIKSSNTDT